MNDYNEFDDDNLDNYDDDDQYFCDEEEQKYWEEWASALDDLNEGGDGGDFF